jgi:predicted phosphodiesterase
MSRVLAIPDMHYPFQHKDALGFLTSVRDAYGTDTTVCLGDLIDFHAISDYVTDQDGWSAGHEYKAAMKGVANLYEEFPEALACFGNHDIRAYKKAFNAGIPKDFLKDYNDIVNAPEGWQWAEEHEVDGVLYMHGNGYTGVYATRHMMMNRMKSVVHGHTHGNAGVMHIQTSPTEYVMGMNAGCLVDGNTYAMAYAKYARTKSSMGCGLVIDGVPFWIPMLLNKSGKRWNGVLV